MQSLGEFLGARGTASFWSATTGRTRSLGFLAEGDSTQGWDVWSSAGIFARNALWRSAGVPAETADLLLSQVSAVSTAEPEYGLAAPIIFDLDRDGKTILALADSKTLFDMAGDGQLHKTAWTDAGDAFLVRDRNGNGIVDGVSEISFVADKAGAKTDLEGLAGFDANGDKRLDANDESFVGFSVWIDADANGRTDAGELQSLAEAGITSISLVAAPTGQTAAQKTGGNSVIYNTSTFTLADGTIGSLSDAGLAFDTVAQGAVTAWTMKPGFADDSFKYKSRKSRISAAGGQLVVRGRGTEGLFDPMAGAMAPATFIHFRDKTVGMLGALILDLDGDGLDLEHQRKSDASFDMDGNGARDNAGWVGKGDGFLVIDRNNDGRITSGSELSFLAEKAGAGTNFEGLAVLDANKDGKISAADARFAELKIWYDSDRDGFDDAGELRTLADFGITEVSIRNSASQAANQKIGSDVILSTAVFTQNGRTRTVGDVALAFSPSKAPAASAAVTATAAVKTVGAAELLDEQVALIRQAMNGFAMGGAAETLLDTAAAAQHLEFYAATAA